ncbi:MAG TPA: hypothetical protein ENF69_01595 [Euryarchaeota archaeon]|nr:hypothetical protein [Euryarchaeota archaeon]
MVRRWMVLAMLGLLALGVPYFAAASGPGGECHAEGDGDGREHAGEGPGGEAAEERMCMMAEEAHMFGQIEEESENLSFSGRFVEFSLSENMSAIEDYTMEVPEETLLLESVVWGEVTGATYTVSGAHFRLTSDEVLVDAHNNPAAILMVRVYDSRDMVYTLPEGAKYTADERFVNMSIGDLEAVIIYVNATLSAEGGTLTFTPTSTPYHIIFRIVPAEGVAGHMWEREYTEALKIRKAVGEMRIAISDGEHMADQFAYRENVRMELKHAERNRVRIEVSGEGEGGVMLLQMNREALQSRVRVYFDGEEVKEAENLGEVLEATGEEPLYYSEPAEKGSQYFAVYIPHFSTHTIEIVGVEEWPLADYLPYIAVGIVVLLVAAIFLALRKRK